MRELARSRLTLLLGVWSAAFLVRFLHNQALLADPLYFNPLGGNLPYLQLAERIAGGDLMPIDGAFTINSPLYPYFVGLVYRIFGVGAVYEVRLLTAALDAGTCAAIAHLASSHFGRVAGWGAGLSLAVFGPMVFFATDLTPVPLTLFLMALALVFLDGRGSLSRFAIAGVLLGLASGTRPNVLLAGGLALAVPFFRGLERPARLSSVLCVGLGLGLAPVTVVNWAASGRFVLLTMSAGHNFYIGHNPAAEAQYSLPAPLDGNIFESMMGLAEEVEGRPFAEEEVSGYYLRRGLAHFRSDPWGEVQLFGRRSLLLLNDFEATTYSSYEYQRHYSAVLRWAPTLAMLLVLAAPGALLLVDPKYWHFWLPTITAALSVLGFFYIARLRIIMVPSLGLFAGAAVAAGVTLVRQRRWLPLGVGLALGIAGFGLSSLPVLRMDTSNEWNKAGGVLRALGRFPEAEAALAHARAENPDNPDTYRNLAVLYRQTGRSEQAEAAEARASEIRDVQEAAGAAFRRALESP